MYPVSGDSPPRQDLVGDAGWDAVSPEQCGESGQLGIVGQDMRFPVAPNLENERLFAFEVLRELRLRAGVRARPGELERLQDEEGSLEELFQNRQSLRPIEREGAARRMVDSRRADARGLQRVVFRERRDLGKLPENRHGVVVELYICASPRYRVIGKNVCPFSSMSARSDE